MSPTNSLLIYVVGNRENTYWFCENMLKLLGKDVTCLAAQEINKLNMIRIKSLLEYSFILIQGENLVPECPIDVVINADVQANIAKEENSQTLRVQLDLLQRLKINPRLAII